jgi:LacI family transcriptional regulator
VSETAAGARGDAEAAVSGDRLPGHHGPGGTELKAEARAIDALVDRQVDGILMVAPVTSKAPLEQVAGGVPTVVLGPHERSAVYDSVIDDDDAGVELVTEHLIALGHRRIAHITHKDGSRRRPAATLQTIRAETYRRVMRDHGLADEIAIATTSYTEEGGHQGARELLARSRRPTAIFAGADLAAFGALAAIHEAGLERIEGRTASVRFSVNPALVPRRSTGPVPRG